jgi:dephospho-CoA kinase
MKITCPFGGRADLRPWPAGSLPQTGAVLLLGVTGGIGMGKSTSADLLERWGYRVVDTDLVAREVVAPGQPALTEVRDAFGPSSLRPDGTLDRAWMAERVFADPGARGQLEGILHPRIRAEWERRVTEWRQEGTPLAVVVIPLLFETEAGAAFDATVCVACSTASQRKRLGDRGWSPEHIERRISAQLPVEEKIRRSTYMVWTEPPLAEHAAQWRVILAGWDLTP